MKYKIVREDIIKNLIEFLDEVQFDAATENTTDAQHKINFCNWAIQELLNSFNVVDGKQSKNDKKKPSPKTRNDYIEETFLDWNLPEMSDKEFEKLVDNFDNFLRAWEKEYLKNNPLKKPKDKSEEGEWKPRVEDVAQHCSLEEIRDMLLDDNELTDKERFDLYYEEHERVQKEKKIKDSKSLNQILKKIKLKLPPKDERN